MTWCMELYVTTGQVKEIIEHKVGVERGSVPTSTRTGH